MLEYIIPDGQSNQFAFNMVNSYVKLQTPIKSTLRYPSLADQRKRFQDNGFTCINDARTLFSLWEDDTFLDCNEREALDSVESFDEWEEFSLFASHHFILKASVKSLDESTDQTSESSSKEEQAPELRRQIRTLTGAFVPSIQNQGLRRHGASVMLSPTEIFHQGGYGPRGRLSNADVYVQRSQIGTQTSNASTPKQYFAHEAVCHSLTRMKNGTSLLVGGRRSPDEALQACFLESRGAWTRVQDLPTGRYRHISVPFEDGILVIGGKINSTKLADEWLYWEYGKGWNRVNFIGEEPPARFGGAACNLPAEFTSGPGPAQSSALLAGGVGISRVVLTDVWQIDLIFTSPDGSPVVRCWQPTLKYQSGVVDVGGFAARMIEHARNVWVVGGIGKLGYNQHAYEICRINKNYEVANFQIAAPDGESIPRPLLVGHQVASVEEHSLLIFGGGATCFPYGTSWNRGTYSVATKSTSAPRDSWKLIPPSKDFRLVQRRLKQMAQPQTEQSLGGPMPIPIDRIQVQTEEDFEALLTVREPAIMEGLALGGCVDKWSDEYLKNRVGEGRPASDLCLRGYAA